MDAGSPRAQRFAGGANATLEELESDPHALLARLREREPASWVPALDGWLITRHDLAMRLMRDPQTFTVDDPRFSTGRVVGPSMLSLDGPEHERHRTPFTAPFRLGAVRARMEATVREESAETVAYVAYTVFVLFQRRGFAAEGCGRIIRHLLEDYGVEVVAAEVDTRNTASVASLGFERVATLPNPHFFKGATSDEYRYELRRAARG